MSLTTPNHNAVKTCSRPMLNPQPLREPHRISLILLLLLLPLLRGRAGAEARTARAPATTPASSGMTYALMYLTSWTRCLPSAPAMDRLVSPRVRILCTRRLSRARSHRGRGTLRGAVLLPVRTPGRRLGCRGTW